MDFEGREGKRSLFLCTFSSSSPSFLLFLLFLLLLFFFLLFPAPLLLLLTSVMALIFVLREAQSLLIVLFGFSWLLIGEGIQFLTAGKLSAPELAVHFRENLFSFLSVCVSATRDCLVCCSGNREIWSSQWLGGLLLPHRGEGEPKGSEICCLEIWLYFEGHGRKVKAS